MFKSTAAGPLTSTEVRDEILKTNETIRRLCEQIEIIDWISVVIIEVSKDTCSELTRTLSHPTERYNSTATYLLPSENKKDDK
jgi:hypothetical protein